MNFFKNKILLATGSLVLILALAAGGYYFFSFKNLHPATTADETKRLVSEVGKLMDLPFGETPTIATVTDITKLKGQPFFQKAKNGDKVLIYTTARKAILYDPQAGKIIDVAPLNIGTQSAQPAQPKVILANGTDNVGLTLKIQDELKKTYPDLDVIDRINASKSNYDKTIVVILNDSGKDLAKKLADTLKVEIGNLPSGEGKPKDGDILVILGKDAAQ